MSNVTEMRPLRYRGFTCECGNAWFALMQTNGNPGVLCFDKKGSITGYSGFPVCTQCGRRGPYRGEN